MHRALCGDTVQGFVFPIVTRAGECRELQWSGHGLRDADGRITHVVAVGHDITDLHRSEQELRRNSEQLSIHVEQIKSLQEQIEYILGAAKTSLCIRDAAFQLEYVDRATQRIYGDPAGKLCYEYFKRRSAPRVDCGAVRALQSMTTVVTEETMPEEGNRPVLVTSIPIQNERGKWQIARVLVDISHQKRLEHELAHAQKLEAIGQLAAGIAHEINTPTQYIGDNVRFLENAFGSIDGLLRNLALLLDGAADGGIAESRLAEFQAGLAEADLGLFVGRGPQGHSRVAGRSGTRGHDRPRHERILAPRRGTKADHRSQQRGAKRTDRLAKTSGNMSPI